MELPSRFTYPFRYVPHPLVVEAAQALIEKLSSRATARDLSFRHPVSGETLCFGEGV